MMHAYVNVKDKETYFLVKSSFFCNLSGEPSRSYHKSIEGKAEKKKSVLVYVHVICCYEHLHCSCSHCIILFVVHHLIISCQMNRVIS